VLRVLLVTGAYFPEFSSGGLQSQAVAAALRGHIRTTVVTTSTSDSLPPYELIEDVEVYRVRAGPGSGRLAVAWALFDVLRRVLPVVDLVHVQGHSSKNVIVAALAKLFRVPLIVHLQTSRHDEPPAVRGQGPLAWWSFAAADRYISVSPGLEASAVGGGIPAARIKVIPNGVDGSRFTPAAAAERRAFRAELGLSADLPLVLFVGVITPDKQPHVLLDAWATMQNDPATQSTVVFVGATNPDLFELGDRLIDDLQATAARLELADRVQFVQPTQGIEKYFRAADMLVMPSMREGCPNVVLEAMACGLPVVASRLTGATDAIIEGGTNGMLVEVGDTAGFAGAMAALLRDPELSARLGAAARRTIEERFRIEWVAAQWLAIYQVLTRP